MKQSSYSKLKKRNSTLKIVLMIMTAIAITAASCAVAYGVKCRGDVAKYQEEADKARLELETLRKLQGNDYETLHNQYAWLTPHYYKLIYANGLKYLIHPKTMGSLFDTESEGNPHAVSISGAEGFGQLMPATAKLIGVTDSFDPEQNIRGSTEFFRHCYNRSGGNLEIAFMKYNAGPARGPKREDYPEVSRVYADRCMKKINRTTALAML